MQRSFRSLWFWIAAALGGIAMFLLSMWQLDWLPYLAYPHEWGNVDWLSLDVILAIAVSLLTGFNLGAMVELMRHQRIKRAAGSSALGMIGAGVGYFAFACIGCHAAVLSIFGIALGINALEPWIPAMRLISLILLIIATSVMWRKLKHPSHCDV